jgi:hypothetical protein
VTAQQATILAAVIAAVAAIFGYLTTRIADRNERKARTYAEALRALRTYQEFPYIVYRRGGSDAKTRERLGNLHTPVVGLAFAQLLEQTGAHRNEYRKWAWRQPIMTSDEEAATSPPFDMDNEPEMELCLGAMKSELSRWPRRRGHILKRLERQRLLREAEPRFEFRPTQQ